MDSNFEKSESVRQMEVKEVTIGQTTYIVRTNAKSVSPEFVKKTVKKILIDALAQKS